MMKRMLLIAAAVIGSVSTIGCVERTLNITSEPEGALVYLNDEEVGRTPVSIPFTFYGTYDVRLEHEGYQALWTQQRAKAPWWEAPGPDLAAEVVPHHKTEQNWHFTMSPLPEPDSEKVVERAKQLRATLRNTTPATQPAE